MIPKITERNILRGGNFDESEMDIDTSSKAHVFKILRDYTYTDKIGSPVREYIANALDEHIKAGTPEKPVEVTFPTVFANEFRIRDFGVGLYPAVYRETCIKDVSVIENNEIVTKTCGGKVVVSNWKGVCESCGESKKNLIGGVRKFFGDYGASDKRNTNKLIGAFGIGCKSAFAYTDSFTVVSIRDGIKWTFNLYIDESEVGKVGLLNEEQTTDASGVEIIIPVKPEDVNTFINRGLDLMKYFKTRPAIKGIANPPSFERPEPPVSGQDWKYFGDGRGTVIIQGQIGYPLDIAKMGSIDYYSVEPQAATTGHIYKWEYDLLKSGMEIEVPIGEVEVTASREQLQMTPQTIATIRAKLAKVREEIVDLVSEKFKSAKNLIEAKTAYYNFFQKGGSYGATLEKSIGKIRWNGLEITDSTIRLNADKHKVMQYKRHHNGDIKLVTFDKIQCSDELNLYFDDTDRKMVNYRRRANTLLNAGVKTVTVIQTDDVKAFKEETGVDPKKLAKYSKIVPTALVSIRGGGNGPDASKRVKHKLTVFELDWPKLRDASRVRGAKSDYWKTTDIEVDKQLYVPIHRFEPNGLFQNDLQTLRDHLNDLHLLGIDVENVKIYGVKAGQDTGEMVRVDEWALEQTKALPNLAHEVAIIKDYQTRKLFEFVLDKELPKGSTAEQYRTAYNEVITLMGANGYYSTPAPIRARLNLAQLAKIELPDEGKLIELSEQFKKQYPLMNIVYKGYFNQYSQSVFDYISLVDEARARASVTNVSENGTMAAGV